MSDAARIYYVMIYDLRKEYSSFRRNYQFEHRRQIFIYLPFGKCYSGKKMRFIQLIMNKCADFQLKKRSYSLVTIVNGLLQV